MFADQSPLQQDLNPFPAFMLSEIIHILDPGVICTSKLPMQQQPGWAAPLPKKGETNWSGAL